MLQVELQDLIILESVKNPGIFLHVSLKIFSENVAVSEVNCGIEHSTFAIYRHYSPQHADDVMRVKRYKYNFLCLINYRAKCEICHKTHK